MKKFLKENADFFRFLKKSLNFFFCGIGMIWTVGFFISLLPIPIFESNSTTLMCPSKQAQEATAAALAQVLGKPTGQLNTGKIDRFLFADGTSIDFLKQTESPTHWASYDIGALKTIVLPPSAGLSPQQAAQSMESVLKSKGFLIDIMQQPDPAFPAGNIVIVKSNAFCSNQYPTGFAILIRKKAVLIGGPTPR